jgi:tricorn protease
MLPSRSIEMELKLANYAGLTAGKPGVLYFLTTPEGNRFADRAAVLSRFVFDTRKTEKLSEHVDSFDLSADGEKMLLALLPESPVEDAQA